MSLHIEYLKNKYGKHYSYVTNRFWELVTQWEKTYPNDEIFVSVNALKSNPNNKRSTLMGVKKLKKIKDQNDKRASNGPPDEELSIILKSKHKVRFLDQESQTNNCEYLEKELSEYKADFEINMSIIKQELQIEKDNLIDEFNKIVKYKEGLLLTTMTQTDVTFNVMLKSDEEIKNNVEAGMILNNNKREKSKRFIIETKDGHSQTNSNEILSPDPLTTKYINVVTEKNKKEFIETIIKIKNKEVESKNIDEDGVDLLKLIKLLSTLVDSTSAKLLVKSYLETVNKLLFLSKITMKKCDDMISLLSQLRNKN